ncbi:MAG: TonB family protein [Candidatus Omnitrophica bacterium]|nr:TonB family protein [Candidatus Omnitrophota bacterium]MBU4478120.1 TonB family protein [Candidatus Omnitrophota bacterium]MCG2704039.1 TonB family protein [Candidatus Omnitrophota bacterium]
MTADNNVYITTFFISLSVHAVVLLPLPSLHRQVRESTPQIATMNYLLVKLPAAMHETYHQQEQSIARNRQKQTEKSSQKKPVLKTTKPAAALKAEQCVENKQPQERESLASAAGTENKQIITRNSIAEKELAKDKTYISYYQLINQQLRQSVVYPQKFSEGEVAISFVLGSDGSLRSVEIMNDIIPDDSLREAAIQIVKNASPFPPFPESLQKSQLTFNVVICFRERT